jgi:hypothetical protein
MQGRLPSGDERVRNFRRVERCALIGRYIDSRHSWGLGHVLGLIRRCAGVDRRHVVLREVKGRINWRVLGLRGCIDGHVLGRRGCIHRRVRRRRRCRAVICCSTSDCRGRRRAASGTRQGPADKRHYDTMHEFEPPCCPPPSRPHGVAGRTQANQTVLETPSRYEIRVATPAANHCLRSLVDLCVRCCD